MALTPLVAGQSGLTNRAVKAFEFVPVRLSFASPPLATTKETKPAPPTLTALWDGPQAMTHVFRATDPRYQQILGSCLKNLLADLDR